MVAFGSIGFSDVLVLLLVLVVVGGFVFLVSGSASRMIRSDDALPPDAPVEERRNRALVRLVDRVTILVAVLAIIVTVAAHASAVIGGAVFWGSLIVGWLIRTYLIDRDA